MHHHQTSFNRAMLTSNHLAAIRGVPFLAKFDDTTLDVFCSHVQHRAYKAGDTLIKEGDAGATMVVILEGSAEVYKGDAARGDWMLQATLQQGAVIGEVALLTAQPRTASVIAVTDLILLEFGADDLDAMTAEKTANVFPLIMELARQSSARLARTTETSLGLLRKQIETARFFVFLMLITAMYIAMSSFAAQLSLSVTSTLIGVAVLGVFAAMAFRVMLRSSSTLSFYGIALRGATSDFVHAMVVTVPLCLALLTAKYAALTFAPAYQNTPLFSGDISLMFTSGTFEYLPIVGLLGYAIHSCFQETIIRGCAQSSLEAFLGGPRRVLQAALFANLMFAVMHVHISLELAAAIFCVGLLWAWMRTKHQTIVGICASHILLGEWMLNIVGVAPV